MRLKSFDEKTQNSKFEIPIRLRLSRVFPRNQTSEHRTPIRPVSHLMLDAVDDDDFAIFISGEFVRSFVRP